MLGTELRPLQEQHAFLATKLSLSLQSGTDFKGSYSSIFLKEVWKISLWLLVF